MFKKIISVLFLGFVFLNGAAITLEDMQKYEQYKSMIADVSNPSNENKQIKTQNISNMIQLESNDTVNVIDSEQVKLKNLFLYDKESIELKRFADNFFANKNPLDMNVIPTSNNYILNNGDTLMINTYGAKSSKNYELKVDNNGNINIPNIGLLKIVSLSLAEAKTLITNTISKAFPNTKVIVDITGYSSIQVVLAGNIKVPGIYNLSSFSTIKDAIIAAGGVQDYGSYRQIDLVRNGKVVFTFDLYKLITDKSKLQDITLRSGDRLMVSFAKKIINLSGKVKNEAIFELTENETFEDLMKYSGGFRFDATKESIRLTRYDSDKKLKTYLLSKEKFYAMTPQDGDKIEVFNNYEIKERPYIFVSGKVVGTKQNKYQYYEGITLQELYKMVTFKSELIKEADGKKIREPLLVDQSSIKIIRYSDEKKNLYVVGLHENIVLKPFDEVEFFNYFDTHPRKYATIKGEVYKPGRYLIDDATTLQDLIRFAGGFTEKAYFDKIEVLRYSIKNKERVRNVSSFNINDDVSINFKIAQNDEITIFAVPNWYDNKTIELKGEVKFPGVYTIQTGETLSSVIKRAGGFTDEAFLAGAMFTRESLRVNEEKRMKESILKLKQQMTFMASNGREAGAQEQSSAELMATINMLEKQAADYKALGRLVISIEKDLQKFQNSTYDIRLEDKDTLIVPSVNDTVSVYGEVLNANSFVFHPDLDVTQYLSKAGGLTQRADEESIYMVLANGEAKKITQGYLFASDDQKISKGATIVVPMKIDKVSNILLWKEVSQIVYQLAITAASLNTVGAI